jgi:hypothetical protein
MHKGGVRPCECCDAVVAFVASVTQASREVYVCGGAEMAAPALCWQLRQRMLTRGCSSGTPERATPPGDARQQQWL